MIRHRLRPISAPKPLAKSPSRPTQRANWSERYAIIAIWNLLIAGLYGEIFGQTQIFALGFYTLHIVDPLAVVSALSALFAILRGRFRYDRYVFAAAIIAVLIAANLLRGLRIDPGLALLSFRGNAAIGSVLLMAVLMKPTPSILRAAERALVLTAASLCVLIVLRFIFGPLLFVRVPDITASDFNDGGRPVSQVGAFIMVFAEIVLLSRLVRAGRITKAWRDWLTLLLPIMILATGQGTATVAAVIVLGLVFAIERGPYLVPRIGIAVFAATGALLIVIIYLSDLTHNAVFSHRADNLGTRSAVWHALSAVWPTLSYTDQLFGVPDGQTPKFFIFQNYQYRIWDRSMHSMYFGALPIMGYVGFIAFFGLMAMLLWTLAPIGPRRRISLPSYPFALCVAILVLSVSYEIRNEALIAILIPIWWLRAVQASHLASVQVPKRRGAGAVSVRANPAFAGRPRTNPR